MRTHGRFPVQVGIWAALLGLTPAAALEPSWHCEARYRPLTSALAESCFEVRWSFASRYPFSEAAAVLTSCGLESGCFRPAGVSRFVLMDAGTEFVAGTSGSSLEVCGRNASSLRLHAEAYGSAGARPVSVGIPLLPEQIPEAAKLCRNCACGCPMGALLAP